MREDGSGKNWIVTINSRLRSEQVFIHASWRKALPYKYLGLGGRAEFAVSIYGITTYDNLTALTGNFFWSTLLTDDDNTCRMIG
jgi:hypothetical protein